MKKAIIAVLLAATSSMALAAATGSGKVVNPPSGGVDILCDGATPGGGKAQVWGGSGYVLTDTEKAAAKFSRAGFDIQCSANAHVSFQESSSNLAAVGSGSAKGNQSYAGHTNGGAIVASAKCSGTNDACSSTDVATAIGEALTKATQ